MKRTNYGEADRIISIITPLGKLAAIVKGVRKERSKLAGGVEMFTLSDLNIHTGKSELGVVTSARMIRYHSEIIKDLNKMELAAAILKRVSRAAEHSDNPELFVIVDQSLNAINNNNDLRLVEAWYLLNLKKTVGEEVNLYRDVDGKKLAADEKYKWDDKEMTFYKDEDGEYGVNEIKLMRLMASNKYEVLRRVRVEDEILWKVLRLVRMVV